MTNRASAPIWRQVTLMTWRNLVTIFRIPDAIIPSIAISVFFLVIYDSTLGEAAGFLPDLSGKSYIGFILPLAIVSAALGGGGIAAQNLVRDLESRYFDKLLLTPVNRAALLLGVTLAGAVLLALQTVIVLGVGFLMGLRPETGLTGVLVVLLMSVLVGMSIAGFTIAVALRTGNAAATQGASFIFFPLTFITASFVPLDLLSGWLKTAAQINPITYVLEAMRALMNDGWDATLLLEGGVASLLMAGATYLMAVYALHLRTTRK